MEIVELEPPTGRELQRHHRHGGIAPRENIRAMVTVAPTDILALHADTAPPRIERDAALGVREVATIVRLLILHAEQVVQIRPLVQFCPVNLGVLAVVILAAECGSAVPRHIAQTPPHTDMMRNIHTQFRSPPTLDDKPFLAAQEFHSQNRLYAHLEEFVLCHIRELRIGKREIISASVGILHIVRHHRIPLERILIEIERQVLALAMVQQRVGGGCLNEHIGYLLAGIRLDGSLMRDHTIRHQLIQIVVNLGVLQRDGNRLCVGFCAARKRAKHDCKEQRALTKQNMYEPLHAGRLLFL